MCIDACIEMCIGARVDVCTDMCLHMCVRVCGLSRARRRVRGMVARTQQLAGQARRGGPSQPPTSSQVGPPGRRPVKACQTRPKTGFFSQRSRSRSRRTARRSSITAASSARRRRPALHLLYIGSISALYRLYICSISALHLLYIGSPSAFTSASPAACPARVYGRAGTRSDTPRRGLPSEACTTDGRYH